MQQPSRYCSSLLKWTCMLVTTFQMQ